DKEVFLLDILPREELLPDEHPTNRSILFESLEENEVELIDKARVQEVDKNYVKYNRKNIESKINTNSIVIAIGRKTNNELLRELKKRKGNSSGPKIHVIGDCNEVRDIYWAIREGFELAAKL
ncbi:MAG: FAD-dependent oxidoreductase, partial [Atribacterota bacterium]